MKTRRQLSLLSIVSALFVIFTVVLYANRRPLLERASDDLAAGRACVLRPGISADTLAGIMHARAYFDNREDARAAAEHIAGSIDSLGRTPDNLGWLNRSAARIPTDAASAVGGRRLRARADRARMSAGLTDEVARLYAGGSLRSEIGSGERTVTVRVLNDRDSRTDGADSPAEGVIVRLTEHKYVSRADGRSSAPVLQSVDSLLGYAMTDRDGRVSFHVPADGYYSVLPVRAGYEYGQPLGTVDGPLTSDRTFTFRQRTHTMPVFDGRTYARVKRDHSLLVRTPETYIRQLAVGAALFLLVWWLAFGALKLIDRRLGRQSDLGIPLLAMALTGVMWIAMQSVADPLTDMPRGWTMTQGVVLGVAAMVAVSCVNFVKFHLGQSRLQMGVLEFDFVAQGLRRLSGPFRGLTARPAAWFAARNIRWPAGGGYLLAALGLVLLLGLFGYGPEGSDAKVNLWGFQPSEVSKYLIVIFFAAFFAANAEGMQFFGERLAGWSLRRYAATVLTVLAAILLLALLYVKVLSDMGPALVILVTFIILYSYARNDTLQLALGFVSFAVMLLAAAWLPDGSTPALVLTDLLWLGLWIAVPYLRRRRVYESAVFLNMLVLMFLVGGQLLTVLGLSEGRRLLNRTAMAWGGVWNNEVPGGDQVAQGLWALASGGWLGQGPGNGHPETVPAAATDMVLTAVGEIGGWVTAVLVLVCFVMLLHRGLLAGRRAFRPFGFFLGAAISLVLGVQMLVIVAGSLGLIPLTGVAVPFLSYGQSSLIINLACLGILISLSRDNQLVATAANPVLAPQRRRNDGIILTTVLGFIFFLLLTAGYLLRWQVFGRDATLLRPALVANQDGARTAAYNPRISIAMDAVGAGDILDRNGRTLASTDDNGLRRYPYGDHLLLMLGDANTRDVWTYSDGNPLGYVAENRHLSFLRGFDNLARDPSGRPVMLRLTAADYHPSRFLPGIGGNMSFALRDYSALLPVLRDGVSESSVEAWRAAHPARDLRMTVDARLQVALDRAIDRFVTSDASLRGIDALRVSCVVIDAADGDLLASANWPLPSADTIAAMQALREYSSRPYERTRGRRAFTVSDLGLTEATPPGSTAKVMTAMAGFAALGDRAADYKVYVDPHDPEAVERGETSGLIDMRRSIVESSNNYYVNMLHDRHRPGDTDLYDGLERVYRAVGAGLAVEGEPLTRPYILTPGDLGDNDAAYGRVLGLARDAGRRQWQVVRNLRERRTPRPLNYYQTAMAWGQGPLMATPLAMARVAGAVANGGTVVPTRFVSNVPSAVPGEPVRLISGRQASLLDSYMRQQLATGSVHGSYVTGGGKTGTPERSMRFFGDHVNDGWYISYVQSAKLGHPLAVAVRLERVGVAGQGSGIAKLLTVGTVFPTLNALGYRLR